MTTSTDITRPTTDTTMISLSDMGIHSESDIEAYLDAMSQAGGEKA